MSEKLLFKVKDILVYPGQGVGQVTEISDKEIDGKTIRYYVIYLTEIDMTVLIPTDKAEERGLRHVVSKKDAKKALEYLSGEPTAMPSDWKLRYQMNIDLFKNGKILDICSVIRALYHRGKTRDLPSQEKKLYENSYKILQNELKAAMNISAEDAEMLIHKALEPSAKKLGADSADELTEDDIFEDDNFDE